MTILQSILAGLVVIGILLYTGPAFIDRAGKKTHESALNPWLYKDQVTGCEYLASRNDSALAPRIAADGKTHMGCGVKP
jgi:hypothetical protein